MKGKSLSRVRLFATPWTVAYQAPPSMGFSRQEYWSWLPFPSPEDLPNPGIEPGSPALQADTLTSEPPGKPFNEEGTHQRKNHSNITGDVKGNISYTLGREFPDSEDQENLPQEAEISKRKRQ